MFPDRLQSRALCEHVPDVTCPQPSTKHLNRNTSHLHAVSFSSKKGFMLFKAAKSVTFDLIFRNNVSNFQEHSNIAKIWVYILPGL